MPADISELAASGKLGLLGMYERARLLGRQFQIRSTPGQGTTVEVELPVAEIVCDAGLQEPPLKDGNVLLPYEPFPH